WVLPSTPGSMPIRPQRYLLLISIWLCCSPVIAQDRMSLYYPTNVYQLSSNQKRVLDSILYVGWVRDGDSLIIQGYADHQGQADHNFHLSLRRAESIKDHLLSRGWVGHRLRLEGKGELEASDETQTGIPEHRRIDMI